MSAVPPRQPLPIDAWLPAIAGSLPEGGSLLLRAPPGTGKTTRVPGALVDAGVPGEIVVLEPRRLAARAAARRVAYERGCPVGGEVGYQVRHEQAVSERTRIRFVTEGVLTRRCVREPELAGVGVVVLDEFHERHLEGDLALAMLQEIRATIRPDLRVVVMSATLDAGPLREYLAPCAEIEVPEAMHPVRTEYLPAAQRGPMPPRVAEAVQRALRETGGDVLVFLPGAAEIRACARELSGRIAESVPVLPLHGSLEPDEQDAALRPGPVRKVVLSTNVAESSLTIEGVGAVVDTGLARVLAHDPGLGLDVLRLQRISRASADQRRGRAGRTGPGVCYRLWARAEERAMAERDRPEILRVELSGPALFVRAFSGRPPAEFGWFEAPERAALERADALLGLLGALDQGRGRVSEVGRAMLRWPVHPRLARILVDARARGLLAEAAEMVAILAEPDLMARDVLRAERGTAPPAPWLVERHEAWRRARELGFRAEACRAAGLDRAAARAVARTVQQLAGPRHAAARPDHEALARCALLGFPDRVARRLDPRGRDGAMAGGRTVLLPEAAGETRDLVVVLAARGGVRAGERALATLCAPIAREWLAGTPCHALHQEDATRFDPETGRASAWRRELYLDLVLEERRTGDLDPDAARAEAARVLARDPWRWLGEARPLRAWLDRLAWLRAAAPDLGVPELGDAQVAEAAAAVLDPRRSLRDLDPEAVRDALRDRVPGAVRAALAREAPDSLRLPSGREARIEYGPHGPSVAARLQEFFGLPETPRLAGGRVPVCLHLLAPNQRPVQITTDLASFWDQVYPKVRSELRRRYPRHSWPDDPRVAAPQARPARRPRPGGRA
ncbi:MAG: ATP-dependent helicase HrpB [Planctomycetes bacterium]|nr:ATP-dependent helicase HrpB [Planctomycetota bacterium]